LKLNDAVVPMGITEDGALDVPSGTTRNVGWYATGTIPGGKGSAVMDAHVFAAFSALHKLSVGSDIYVVDQNGTKLHFVVSEMRIYALKDVPLQKLFNRSDTARLNLITCAGKLLPDRSTYDHRLVVYATLATP
jgi:sortase (surface protein transpeptidase)